MRIQRLGNPPIQARALVEPLLREYLHWATHQLEQRCGVVIEDHLALAETHHRQFLQELPALLGMSGRLFIGLDDGEVVGVGALLPVDDTTADIKRMYVRPEFRGEGLGRAILRRLLSEARAIGYDTVRLETAVFMTEAQGLYGSLGFRDIPVFERAESSLSGLEPYMRFMELPLTRAAAC